MEQNLLGLLQEKRRSAMLEYCINKAIMDPASKYKFVRTADDVFELLRLDTQDRFVVQNSWVAEAISCAQQFIHAAYRKLEPGYEAHQFDPAHLNLWQLYSNFADWAAVQLITLYPEKYMDPAVRQRKSNLFKTLENDLNQTRLTTDSVQAALRNYLQTFEQTCNLDVISGYMDGPKPDQANYYFIGRQRVAPFQYFWRRAQVELLPDHVVINPAAWGEWQPVDIPAGTRVLDMRPVFWSGRLCLVWAEWRDRTPPRQKGVEDPASVLPARLDINVAFMTQNGQWSAPLNVHSSTRDEEDEEEQEQELARLRLVATIWAGPGHPKGKLGILLTDDRPGDDALRVVVVRDVLFRPVAGDDGGWLKEMVKRWFVDALTIQHPLMNQPQVVVATGVTGSLVKFLDLEALAFRENGKDVLWVRGICRPTGLQGSAVPLKLALVGRTTGDPQDLTGSYPVAGGWKTEWLIYNRTPGGWTDPTSFTFGADATYGRKDFALTIRNVTDFTPATLLKNSQDAAQFLSLNQPSLALKYVRLNSLFGPELVQRSHISVDAVLDWFTQFISEPAPEAGTIDEPRGAFNGANGLFFWELFFHLPHLVATRLRAEDRFAESQQWLHYLFDPQAPADIPSRLDPNPRPLYWRCRALVEDGDSGHEGQAPTDPDAIGYAKPVHFKLKVFTDYVSNLIEWGDWYYRQLTRDSLVAARLCYMQAKFLMGEAPWAQTVNRWETVKVRNLLSSSSSRPDLEQFERELSCSPAEFPAPSDTPPPLGMLANKPFEVPINQSLLDLFALPEQRLDNLRNNLTINGSPRDVLLFEAATDPRSLLRDLASGNAGSVRPMGGRLVVGAFRWRVMYEAALRAVQTLQEYGNQVLRLIEQRDRAELEERRQSDLVELGDYAQSVQEEVISQLQAILAALIHSQKVTQERADTYARYHDENISPVEYDVMADLQTSNQLSLTASSIKPAGAIAAAIPNIVGMAVGGQRLDKAVDAVVFGLGIFASIMRTNAEKKSTTESYRRRRSEWALQRDQALGEVRSLDEQITAQTHALQAARSTLEQTLKANSQALTVYNFLKKSASGAELFGWLLSQYKALYRQAYDAVVSLCLSAQASMAAETGDYDSIIPLPQVWQDNRFGLTAGEHLRGHLLRMEREYLQRQERRLELVKTVSLRQLFEDKVGAQLTAGGWEDALAQLRSKGKLEFELGEILFDRDHPGHYCRQISSVEVDVPVLTGPWQDVRATLLQISSMIATKATYQSAKFLHNRSGVAPAGVLINLRPSQQIVVSTGLADDGMNALRPDEGMLKSFECTGAVSRWVIQFPWWLKEPQKTQLLSLTDIILRIRYTAKAGDPAFVRKIHDLVQEVESSAYRRDEQGVSRHE